MKTSKLIVVLLLGVMIYSCSTTDTQILTNPNASKKAVNLYKFLQELNGEYTLSGQHNFCGKESVYTDQLEEINFRDCIWMIE